tara:strand:+ start:1725 stop:1976 length:252 start_codon:yes stop_codon:yes gene_type:complete
MELRINNILELQLLNDDVDSFVDLFGTLKNEIQNQSKKVGFKKNGKITLELHEDTIGFIFSICENSGILSESEIAKKEKEQDK